MIVRLYFRRLIYLILLVLIACNNGEKVEPSGSNNKTIDSSNSLSAGQINKAKSIISTVTSEDLAAVDGNAKYKMYCTNCHGFKGDLQVSGAKDLRKIMSGLEERVAQVYFGKGLMTAFKGVLTDAEIVAVAKHVGSLKE